MVDAAIVATNVISQTIIAEKRDVVSSVEVFTQDTEFDLDNDFE